MTEPRNIARAYPDLFVDAWAREPQEWPFACGEGWSEILDDLFSDLRRIYREERVTLLVTSVKEKLGVLRVRVDNPHPRIAARIQEALEASSRTCDGCGRPSAVRSVGGWITTRCDECLAKRKAEIIG